MIWVLLVLEALPYLAGALAVILILRILWLKARRLG